LAGIGRADARVPRALARILPHHPICPCAAFAMSAILSCYYLDEPLAEHDLRFVENAVIGPWAKFKTQAAMVKQKRVPLVLPAPDAGGHYAQDCTQRAELVRHNLRHAGMRGDSGRQIVWVAPRDAEWDAIFQCAIRKETGFAPFVAQRWFLKDGALRRGPVRVVNAQMLIEGL
jgi:hypothetical protein